MNKELRAKIEMIATAWLDKPLRQPGDWWNVVVVRHSNCCHHRLLVCHFDHSTWDVREDGGRTNAKHWTASFAVDEREAYGWDDAQLTRVVRYRCEQTFPTLRPAEMYECDKPPMIFCDEKEAEAIRNAPDGRMLAIKSAMQFFAGNIGELAGLNPDAETLGQDKIGEVQDVSHKDPIKFKEFL